MSRKVVIPIVKYTCQTCGLLQRKWDLTRWNVMLVVIPSVIVVLKNQFVEIV